MITVTVYAITTNKAPDYMCNEEHYLLVNNDNNIVMATSPEYNYMLGCTLSRGIAELMRNKEQLRVHKMFCLNMRYED